MSWINHLPPVCWSTFWKSTFEQQLDCRFDIMDCKSSLFYWYFDICNCVCLKTSYDFLFHLYILNSVHYFYQVLLSILYTSWLISGHMMKVYKHWIKNFKNSVLKGCALSYSLISPLNSSCHFADGIASCCGRFKLDWCIAPVGIAIVENVSSNPALIPNGRFHWSANTCYPPGESCSKEIRPP